MPVAHLHIPGPFLFTPPSWPMSEILDFAITALSCRMRLEIEEYLEGHLGVVLLLHERHFSRSNATIPTSPFGITMEAPLPFPLPPLHPTTTTVTTTTKFPHVVMEGPRPGSKLRAGEPHQMNHLPSFSHLHTAYIHPHRMNGGACMVMMMIRLHRASWRWVVWSW